MRHYIVESVRRPNGQYLKFLPVAQWETTQTREREARRIMRKLEKLPEVTVLRLSVWEGDDELRTGHYVVRQTAPGARERIMTQIARPHGHDLESGRYAVGEWRESLGEMMDSDAAMLVPLEELR